ncbi:MAG TPA: hypothetical protein VLU94_02140 [Candidatus Nitrosotalea sp.]|nr:hypothetical protein [Candidatus Nitrosotalea sp.]
MNQSQDGQGLPKPVLNQEFSRELRQFEYCRIGIGTSGMLAALAYEQDKSASVRNWSLSPNYPGRTATLCRMNSNRCRDAIRSQKAGALRVVAKVKSRH